MKMRKIAGMLAIGVALAACARSEVLPLAPNMVRIDTRAQGLIAQSQAVPQTMRTAAKATLDAGYTHFRFADANLGQGSMYAGSIGNASGSVTGTRNSATFSGWGSSSALYTPTTNAAVTVIMFKANEQGAKGAFDAKEIYQKYQQ
jgi:hypothetical protein